MNNQFSPRVSQILVYSKEEACRLHNTTITPEHLLLGLLREENGQALKLLQQLNIHTEAIRHEIEYRIGNVSVMSPLPDTEDITLDKNSSQIIKQGLVEAQLLNCTFVESEHLLLAILKDHTTMANQILMKYDITYKVIFKMLTQAQGIQAGLGLNNEEDDDMPESTSHSSFSNMSSNQTTASRKNGDTPILDNFGVDLTLAAEERKLDPVVGRNKEIERIAQILSRRKKNNPILIGEPGVGKSAIVEGLALRIIQRKVSRTLLNKRIIALDMASVVAGTKYRGQFEERLRNILDELKKNPEIILFIDEIHTIVGAGSTPGSMDAANMLKPALARGEIQCIGATTIDEYRKTIEKDGALERRFQKILVEPTNEEETLQILQNIKERYEEHHNVIYTEEALKACIKLTERYISDRCFPDKAIDALDEAGARVHIVNITVPKEIEEQEQDIITVHKQKNEAVHQQDFERAADLRDREEHMRQRLETMKQTWENNLRENKEIVDRTQVEDVVSVMSGVPVQKMAQAENIRLKGMKDILNSQVISQEDAIDKIVKAIMRSRIGIKDPNRPIGTFMFLGPTGVGKTLLAKKIAEFMFGTTDALIRIDMSEYMEKYSVSRLVGAPPGYVGYEEGGQLTEKVRRKPYSIILLDEIEKAHGDVFNLLLQVMDEGRLTDGNGCTVDFKNTVIIMTSNCGTRQLKEFGRGIGFSFDENSISKEHQADEIIKKALNKEFAPEFLNRLDEIVTFKPLTPEAIGQIANIELSNLAARMSSLGYTIVMNDAAKHFLIQKGYDKQYGARPLKRAIQRYVEDRLCELLMNEEIPERGTIQITYAEGSEELTFKCN